MNSAAIQNLLGDLKAIKERMVRHRPGVVTSVSPLAVAVAGSDVPYTNVKTVGGPPLAIGDAVSVLAFGNDLVVLGTIGAPTTLFAAVDTQQSTTTSVWVDLATDGPSITIPAAGNYVLAGGAMTYASAGSPTTFVGIYAGAVLVRQMQSNFGAVNNIAHPASEVQVALAAGAVVKLRYGAFSGCTAEFANRWIRATRI